MRVISISVDGIYQACHRGLFAWLSSQDAEIICLQDLRARAFELEDSSEFQLDGYFSYFLDSPDKHCNGVAIYTRQVPKAVMFGFGLASGEDVNGRYLQADYEQFSIITLLVPDAGSEQCTFESKMDFLNGLQSHLLKISRKRRDYIICANLGIAWTDIDVENPDDDVDRTGCTLEERRWLDQLYSDINYTDAFRQSNADTDEFTWWPSGKIGEGYGLRSDTQIISQRLSSQTEYAVLYRAKEFSSHTPVIIDYELQEF
jgi:exodeoxyribonuclease-3